jgi:hypothetical protein
MVKYLNLENWGVRPIAAFLVSYEGQTFEAETPGQILTEIIGTYFQEEEAATRWMVRGKFARRLLNGYAMEGQKAEIYSGSKLIEANYQPHVGDEAEEVLEMEWTDEPPVQIDIEADRTFFKSMIVCRKLVIMEREDVFYFRYSKEWDAVYKAKRSSCVTCRFYRESEDGKGMCIDQSTDGVKGREVAEDAPIGWYCQSYAPVTSDIQNDASGKKNYILIDPEDIHIPEWQTNYVTTAE